MPRNNVEINITGPTLSTLLYENINCKQTEQVRFLIYYFSTMILSKSYELYCVIIKIIIFQEGFLLGSLSQFKKTSVTDYNDRVETIQSINITGVLPCDAPHLFYNGNGELLAENLDKFLGEHKKDVVAWFKYRRFRQFGLRLSLRESRIHHKLPQYFDLNPDLFTCLMLTQGASTNKSTRSFTHAFVTMDSITLREFMIPFHIKNLSEECHIYQKCSEPSETFLKLLEKVNVTQATLGSANDIHNIVQQDIEVRLSEIVSLEAKLLDLQKEMSCLRRQNVKDFFNKMAEGDGQETSTRNSVEVRKFLSKVLSISELKDVGHSEMYSSFV